MIKTNCTQTHTHQQRRIRQQYRTVMACIYLNIVIIIDYCTISIGHHILLVITRMDNKYVFISCVLGLFCFCFIFVCLCVCVSVWGWLWLMTIMSQAKTFLSFVLCQVWSWSVQGLNAYACCVDNCFLFTLCLSTIDSFYYLPVCISFLLCGWFFVLEGLVCIAWVNWLPNVVCLSWQLVVTVWSDRLVWQFEK